MAIPYEKIKYWSLVKELEEQLSVIRDAPQTQETLIDAKASLTGKLQELHEHINSFLLDRDAYFVLFALTAYCDEVVYKKTSSTDIMWSSLQMHLFNVSNAGDVFFDIVNSFRGRYDIPGIVYETYIMTLSLGFEGRYAGIPSSIQRYKDELSSFINTKELSQVDLPAKIKKRLPIRIPVAAYYVAFFLLALLLNAFLQSSADGYMASL